MKIDPDEKTRTTEQRTVLYLKGPDRSFQKRKAHGHVHVQLRRRAYIYIRDSNEHEPNLSDDSYRR